MRQGCERRNMLSLILVVWIGKRKVAEYPRVEATNQAATYVSTFACASQQVILHLAIDRQRQRFRESKAWVLSRRCRAWMACKCACEKPKPSIVRLKQID